MKPTTRTFPFGESESIAGALELIMSVGRNDPCPCNSGRKFKKCCIDKKPLQDVVYIGHAEKFDSVQYDHVNNQAFVTVNGVKKEPFIISRTEYKKNSGKIKILNQVNDKLLLGNIDEYIYSNFSRVFALDTNTRKIRGDKISVCCVLELYSKRKKIVGNKLSIQYSVFGRYIFKNHSISHPEKLSIFRLVNMITSCSNYNQNTKFAIITDHDLRNHKKYNKQELPIYGNILLPINFDLVYASDQNNASMANQLTDIPHNITNIQNIVLRNASPTISARLCDAHSNSE